MNDGVTIWRRCKVFVDWGNSSNKVFLMEKLDFVCKVVKF